MYIPILSALTGEHKGKRTDRRRRVVAARAGGGGGRGGGSSSGGARGGGSSSTSGGSSNSGRTAGSSDKPPPYTAGSPPPAYSVSGSTTVRGATNSAGGGRQYTVGAGQPFAGAIAGGGTRSGVYGNRGYSSAGYTPFFPFMFWPVFFPIYPYYYGSSIYGPQNNASRPGGNLQAYTLLPAWAPNATSQGAAGPSGNTFAIYGDSNSVQDLVPILAATCGASNVYGQNVSVTPFNAVQFYRGDSFSLHLNDYNNSLPNIEVQNPSQSFTDPDVNSAPLPSTVNQTYFNCLNTTVGSYVGLLDSDYASNSAISRMIHPATSVGTIALLAVILHYVS